MSNKLSHTVYDCKFHIVFVPKYRRKVAYVRLRKETGLMQYILMF